MKTLLSLAAVGIISYSLGLQSKEVEAKLTNPQKYALKQEFQTKQTKTIAIKDAPRSLHQQEIDFLDVEEADVVVEEI
jgi:Tfp pilus assembly protein PilO